MYAVRLVNHTILLLVQIHMHIDKTTLRMNFRLKNF